MIDQQDSADKGSMNTSEIDSSAKSSSSEILQAVKPLKRAGTIAVSRLEPMHQPSKITP
jgi:hypothetical protein